MDSTLRPQKGKVRMHMGTSTPNKEPQPEIVVGHRNSPRTFGWLPCRISLEVPADAFTVGDLLRLEVGSVVSTKLSRKDDVPLRVNGVLVGWVQFETIGTHVAVRITELE
jgi:flagellar motor switch protein FliM